MNPGMAEKVSEFLKKSLKKLDSPYKYLTN